MRALARCWRRLLPAFAGACLAAWPAEAGSSARATRPGSPALASAPRPPAAGRALAPEQSLAAQSADLAPIAPPAAGPAEVEPATTWPLLGREQTQRVHAIGAQGERFFINGRPAEVFSRSQIDGDVAEETLVHPDDKDLFVKVYHSPASMGGYERKTQALERLYPLASAEAAPRLIEHGEAAVGGKGRVYFFVQERVDGRRLKDAAPDQWPRREIGALLERLKTAGLALALPAPGRDWLLSHVMVGRTPTDGHRAYLLDGKAQPSTPEKAAAHHAMLSAMLETPPPQPAPVANAPLDGGGHGGPSGLDAAPAAARPTPAPPRAPPGKKADRRLLDLARDLVDGGLEKAAPAIEGLVAGLNASPDRATLELRQLLESRIEDYRNVFRGRAIRAGYVLEYAPLPAKYIGPTYEGKPAGAPRYAGVVDVYYKLLEKRPDLADEASVGLLRRAFVEPWAGGEDQAGDRILVGELMKLASVVSLLSSARPDLLKIKDYAAIVHDAGMIYAHKYESPAFRADVERLHASLDAGLEKAALSAPVEEARQALARFYVHWEPQPGFEQVVQRVGQARPEFAAAMLDSATLESREREAARSSGDWTNPILHAMPVVKDEASVRRALIAAKAGWLTYLAAYKKATYAPKIRPEFYARVYGIGQLFGTRTELGTKMSLGLLLSEARQALEELDLGDGKTRAEVREDFEKFLEEKVKARYPRSANHARKVVQKALLEASLAGNLRYHFKYQPEHSGPAKQSEILASMQTQIPRLLRDFDAGQPSSVAGVLLTGSYAYGAAVKDSDLDLFILTRAGAPRTKEFVVALQRLGQENGWPPVNIPETNFIPAQGERARGLLRSFPCIVYAHDLSALTPGPTAPPAEPFDAPSRGELWAHGRARRRFMKALLKELRPR